MNRRNLEYKTKHVVMYFLCCRHRKKLKDLNTKAGKRDLYLNKIRNKLMDDMDIVQQIKFSRQMIDVYQTLFNKEDRTMMLFQRR